MFAVFGVSACFSALAVLTCVFAFAGLVAEMLHQVASFGQKKGLPGVLKIESKTKTPAALLISAWLRNYPLPVSPPSAAGAGADGL